MKTTYYLVTAAAVAAAALVVHAQLPNLDTPPLPPKTVHASPAVPRLALPPVSSPPDEPLVMPGLPAVPPVKSGVPTLPSVAPVSGAEPSVPSVTGVPLPLPLLPAPTAPLVYTGPGPVVSGPPTEPLIPPVALPLPTPKPVLLPPSAPVPASMPVLEPPVQPVPAPSANDPLEAGGKYVVLKDDKVLEGSVTLRGDVVVVRHGSLDRPFTKSQVQFVAGSKDEVYRFMLAKVPATDAAARLKVARWCMFSGMREQALFEAREVQKLDPRNADATALARSLELSLQQFPPANAPKMSAPQTPTVPAELRTVLPPVTPVPVEPELDVTPEAANLFAVRVQPFLANQCVECHVKFDTGKFKLALVAPGESGHQATRANLRAVAAQLLKDEPVSSPFLVKALTAHGGQKVPAVASRQAVVYQTLEAWTALAVGTPIMAMPAVPPPPMPVPLAPVIPPAPVFVPTLPSVVPVVDPVLPPVVEMLPRTPTLPSVPPPAFPPAVDPALPPVNPVPPVNTAPPVLLPIPATSTPPASPVVPVIPPADPLLPVMPPAIVPLPKPVVPPIPPASAQTPFPLSPVQPASGTQFGTTLPPKPPVSGPIGGDEFDPAGFNQPRK